MQLWVLDMYNKILWRIKAYVVMCLNKCGIKLCAI